MKFYSKIRREHERCMARLAAIDDAKDRIDKSSSRPKTNEKTKEKKERRGERRKRDSRTSDSSVTKKQRKFLHRGESSDKPEIYNKIYKIRKKGREQGEQKAKVPSRSRSTSGDDVSSSSEQYDSRSTGSSEGERLQDAYRVSREQGRMRQSSSMPEKATGKRIGYEGRKERRNPPTPLAPQVRKEQRRKSAAEKLPYKELSPQPPSKSKGLKQAGESEEDNRQLNSNGLKTHPTQKQPLLL